MSLATFAIEATGWLQVQEAMSGRRLIADFVCCELKLIVELDGGQHLEQSDYDKQRSSVLEEHGYRVLRYWNDDVLLRTSLVLEDILRGLRLSK